MQEGLVLKEGKHHFLEGRPCTMAVRSSSTSPLSALLWKPLAKPSKSVLRKKVPGWGSEWSQALETGPLSTSIASKLIKKPFASNYRNQSYLTTKDCEKTLLLMRAVVIRRQRGLGNESWIGPLIWTTIMSVSSPGNGGISGKPAGLKISCSLGLRAVSIKKNRACKGHTYCNRIKASGSLNLSWRQFPCRHYHDDSLHR